MPIQLSVCMYVCTVLGVMHLHPCIGDSGRREEKRKMERQNWASEWQRSPQPQSECWMSEEGLEAPQQILTSLGFLTSGKTSPCKYYIHIHTHTCWQICLHSHTAWVKIEQQWRCGRLNYHLQLLIIKGTQALVWNRKERGSTDCNSFSHRSTFGLKWNKVLTFRFKKEGFGLILIESYF